jgi:hypothetical protein
MQLIKIDVIDTQACQRGVERPPQMPTGEPRVAGRHPDREARLAGEEHRGPGQPVEGLKPGTDDCLGTSVVVDVGGVDEGSAGVEERVQLAMRLVLARRRPEGHRAQREPGYHSAGGAEGCVLH